jgi:hypothetical protein
MSSRRAFLSDAALATGLATLTATAALTAGEPAAASGAAKKGGKGGGPDSPSGYLGQMQVTANLLVNNRPRGVLQVDAGIYSDNPETRAQISASGPMLRSAWRSAAQDFANRFHTLGRVPDTQMLAGLLQAATDRIIGARRCRVMMVSVIAR